MQDWGLNLNLSKSIDFGEKSIFSMEPSITLNASTLGYFTEYVTKKPLKSPIQLDCLIKLPQIYKE